VTLPGAFSNGVSGDSYLEYAVGGTLNHAFSRRTSGELLFGHGASSFSSQSQLGFVSDSAGARITHQLTRTFGLHAGYGMDFARYGVNQSGARVRQDRIDVGVDYGRVLALSRRTTLSFSTGSTIVSDGVTHQFRVIGSANLSREIGRTWRAWAAYNRDVGFLPTLQAPTFSDAASAGLDGLLTRRLGFTAQGGASRGVAGTQVTNDFWAYSGFAGLTYALSRYMGLAGYYDYYRSSFANTANLPTPLYQDVSRRAVTVSLELNTALLQDKRRDNASR
jgi:hypothetical protein